jgi:alkylated DNA repair protein (DNA oxidative demethylase)
MLDRGFRLLPSYLDRREQEALLHAVRDIIERAPLYTPKMPTSGQPMSVMMTNCGSLGWITDPKGYRYEPVHPLTGMPWPPIPPMLVEAWRELARYPCEPEACLVNFYRAHAKMGLHQDRDEADFAAPVVSISLGDRGIPDWEPQPPRSDPFAQARLRRCPCPRR